VKFAVGCVNIQAHSNGECGVLKQIYEITLDKEDGSLIMINLETGEETRDEL
jgi:hypothetical protein